MIHFTYFTNNNHLHNGSTLHQGIMNPLFVYDKLLQFAKGQTF